MDYPKVEEQYDLNFFNDKNRVVTTVIIANGVFVDVMTVQKHGVSEIGLQYIMENELSGQTAYYPSKNDAPAGNVTDYGFTEKEITDFVSKYIGWTEDGKICPTV